MVRAKVTEHPFRDADGDDHPRRSYVDVPPEVADYYSMQTFPEDDDPRDGPICGAMTASGEPCGNAVESPDDHCHLHAEEE